jgi:L-asparaginase
LGDSPIPGAGFYADSRYGAAACTHTGEMTMRCATARTIVLAIKLGHSLKEAVRLAIEELSELEGGFRAGVVIHAVDAQGNHEVVNFRCEGEIRYWLWEETMSEPQLRTATTP